jgi:hypothetical protein
VLSALIAEYKAAEWSMMDRYGHLFPHDDLKAAMDAIAVELMERVGIKGN